jgi:CRISPR-associated endonuclease Csn1
LNSVLRTDGLNLKKNRDDHRHHAVDALVIALMNRRRLLTLADVFKGRAGERLELPDPWDGFREEAQRVVDGIYVSHKPRRKIAGALHEETLYGRTHKPDGRTAEERPHAKDWIEEEGVYVLRKPLESLTVPEVGKIRDNQVRALVEERLRAHGIDPAGTGNIPKAVWAAPLRMVGKRGAEKSPNAPVIKTVRLTKEDKTIRAIREGTHPVYVKPGNTHHICIFEMPGSTPERPKREMVAVTMLEAVGRVKRGEAVICRSHPSNKGAEFLFSLSWGECVEAEIRGRNDVYSFRTAASTQGQIYFVAQADARPSSTATKFVTNANTLSGVKVVIDVLGRIRRAKD